MSYIKHLSLRTKLMVGIPGAIVVVGVAGFTLFAPPSAVPEAGCAGGTSLAAPSGRVLTLCETLRETQASGEVWAVLRVLDPDLPGTRATGAFTDHDWACETWGLDAAMVEPRPTRVVVQVMAEMFPRGEAAPEILQAIEAYSTQGGVCTWELL